MTEKEMVFVKGPLCCVFDLLQICS